MKAWGASFIKICASYVVLIFHLYHISGHWSCCFRSAEKDGCGTRWSCDALCTWPKWESCHPEMHRVHTWRFYPVHYINFLWPSFDIVNPSIWVSCYPGLLIFLKRHFVNSNVTSVTLSWDKYQSQLFVFALQRVLEHCHDPITQRIVMDEIMQCVCMLAQDQYGNYVVQVCCVLFIFSLLNMNIISELLQGKLIIAQLWICDSWANNVDTY